MSSAFSISPFDPESDWGSKGTSRLAKRLCGVGLFARSLRVQIRYGNLTRAPLRLIRFQLKESVAECDWIARVPIRGTRVCGPKLVSGMLHSRH
jgi:hypothetical protein